MVAWGANHQVHVFASPGTANTSLHQWAREGNKKKKHRHTASSSSSALSSGPSFTQLGRLLLTPGNTSALNNNIIVAKTNASIARGSALGESATQSTKDLHGDWVNSLLVNLKGYGNRSKDHPADMLPSSASSSSLSSSSSSSLDARLWQGTWRGRSVKGVANYDAIVLCHDQACPLPHSCEQGDGSGNIVASEASDEVRWANEVMLELPQALRARGWSKVVHVFEADLQALDENSHREK